MTITFIDGFLLLAVAVIYVLHFKKSKDVKNHKQILENSEK